jgi:hypothetical protein
MTGVGARGRLAHSDFRLSDEDREGPGRGIAVTSTSPEGPLNRKGCFRASVSLTPRCISFLAMAEMFGDLQRCLERHCPLVKGRAKVYSELGTAHRQSSSHQRPMAKLMPVLCFV